MKTICIYITFWWCFFKGWLGWRITLDCYKSEFQDAAGRGYFCGTGILNWRKELGRAIYHSKK